MSDSHKLTTEPYKTSPLDRVYLEIDAALADAYQRGKVEGRKEVLHLLTPITTALDRKTLLAMVNIAQAELLKWGM